MDQEHTALRRRMSRVRVQNQSIGSDSEVDTGKTDMYADLIKFWKKRGTHIVAEFIPESRKKRGKLEVARQRGRRKSMEFEDLQMQTLADKLKLSSPDKSWVQRNEFVTVATSITNAEGARQSEVTAFVPRPRKDIPEQQRHFVMNKSTEKSIGKKEKQVAADKLGGYASNPKKHTLGRTISDTALIKDVKPTPTDKSTGLSRKTSEKNSSVVLKNKDENPAIVGKESKK